ncbi:MAG: hypothetical protein CME84_12655 [Henriciella sp.]|nr:hypothetical protein [Henriciella sp.]
MMIVAISSLVILGCQGCSQAQGAQNDSLAGEIDYRLGQTEDKAGPPRLAAETNFSFRQADTMNAPELALHQPDHNSGLRSYEAVGVRTFNDRTRVPTSPAAISSQRMRAAASVVQPVRQIRDFDAQVAISAPTESTGFGFDVGVVPRMSVSKDGPFKQRSVGGEIRIGQNFDKRDMGAYAGSWYLFAGADGEALVYEPDGERNLTNRMGLRNQVTVGDMQAGVSFTRGSGQLSLSYIHREVEYNERGLNGQKAAEDFAGVSFTLRR